MASPVESPEEVESEGEVAIEEGHCRTESGTDISDIVAGTLIFAEDAKQCPPKPVEKKVKLEAKILSSRSKQLWSKPFTVYRMRIAFEPLIWVVDKRYSDFVKLHAALAHHFKERKADVSLPPLPAKKYVGNMKPAFIAERKKHLQEYFTALLAVEAAANAPPLLEFVGMLEASVQPSVLPDIVNSVSSFAFLRLAQPGDLVLFRTQGLLQSMQRSITSSNYDHVGLVVGDPHPVTVNEARLNELQRQYVRRKSSAREQLFIIESTIDGVLKYPLKQRLYAWHLTNAQCVVRRLRCERSAKFRETLLLTQWSGKKYALNPLKFIGKRRPTTAEEEKEKKSFFCSELVASAYKELGLLGDERSSAKYFPATFSQAHNLQLRGGAKLESEVLITFDKPEVSAAKNLEDLSIY